MANDTIIKKELAAQILAAARDEHHTTPVRCVVGTYNEIWK